MAIQLRRGLSAQYDESKILPGEVAVETDSKKVHVGVAAGQAVELATEDDISDLKEVLLELKGQIGQGGTGGSGSVSGNIKTILSNLLTIIERADVVYEPDASSLIAYTKQLINGSGDNPDEPDEPTVPDAVSVAFNGLTAIIGGLKNTSISYNGMTAKIGA